MTTSSSSPPKSRGGRRRLATTSVVVAALLAVSAACTRPPNPPGGGDEHSNKPLAKITLSWVEGDAAPTLEGGETGDPNGATSPRKVTLTCTPDGGTHPDPEAACDALRAVGGNFEKLVWKLVRPDVACPMVYDPVSAVATGHWQASPTGPTHLVDYSRTFGNSCTASLYHNVVFAF